MEAVEHSLGFIEGNDVVVMAVECPDRQMGQSRGLAVAVNDAVVPRADWPAHAVRPHDRITIIRATQGG